MAKRGEGGFTRIERKEGVQPFKSSAPKKETVQQREERIQREKELLAMVMEDVEQGLVQEISITDVDWDGGKDRDCIDIDKIRDEIVRRESLQRVLLSIIDHHDYKLSVPTRKKHKIKDLRTYRLEQAMKFLVGYAPASGPSSRIFAEELQRVAKLYFDSYFGVSGCHDNLNQILIAVRWPEGPPADFDEEQIDNSTNALKKAFLRNKHELLTEFTSPGLPDFDEPRLLTTEVIRILAVLGLAATPAKEKKAQ